MVEKPWLVRLVIAALLMLTACAGQDAPSGNGPPTPMPEDPNQEPPPNPYVPSKGDEAMQRGEVYIDSQEILILESFPLQYQLHVKGSLPTPCHQLRAVINEPNQRSQIHVELFSLVDPDMLCIQVLEPFEANLPFGSYASGSYTVFVNGGKVGEITP
jgi:hypothetical protein